MKQEIYLDTYFLVNALMNWASLFTAGKILSGVVRQKRLILASLGGAVYACAILFFDLKGWPGVILWLGVLAVMCRVAYPWQNVRRFLTLIAASGLCAAAAGGMVSGIQNLSFSRENKVTLTLIVGVVILTVTAFRLMGLKARKQSQEITAGIRLEFGGTGYELSGLCDSGNLLREPLSGFPVLILGNSLAAKPEFDSYYGGKPGEEGNFYAIPLKTVSGSKLLYGFRPDSVEIRLPTKKIRTRDVIVAADPQCESFSDCQCLVPTSIL